MAVQVYEWFGTEKPTLLVKLCLLMEKFINKKGYSSKYVSNCDKTQLFFFAKTCPIVPIFIKVKSWQPGKVRLILVLCGNTAGHILGNENIIS